MTVARLVPFAQITPVRPGVSTRYGCPYDLLGGNVAPGTGAHSDHPDGTWLYVLDGVDDTGPEPADVAYDLAAHLAGPGAATAGEYDEHRLAADAARSQAGAALDDAAMTLSALDRDSSDAERRVVAALALAEAQTATAQAQLAVAHELAMARLTPPDVDHTDVWHPFDHERRAVSIPAQNGGAIHWVARCEGCGWGGPERAGGDARAQAEVDGMRHRRGEPGWRTNGSDR